MDKADQVFHRIKTHSEREQGERKNNTKAMSIDDINQQKLQRATYQDSEASAA